MRKELKKTVFMMGIGIVIYELFLMLLALFIYKHIGYSLLSLELGILVGTFIEFIMLVDMAYVTQDVICSKDAAYANRKTVIRSVIRKVGVLAVIAIFWNSGYVNVIAIVFAVLGMKFGAYSVPLIRKIIK